jgi:glycosyltransferase involved in cell wall biosynthesis
MALNIVQIIPALDAGGAERTVVEITAAIVNAGGQALTITTGGRMEKEVIAAGGQIAYLPVASKNPVVMGRNIARIAHLAKGFKADIIHARSRAPAWSAKAACKRSGLPFVTTYHGTYTAQNALKRRYNAIMAKGDRVIANSHFIARHIMQEHGLEADRITVIARGVDPAFFDVPPTLLKPNPHPVIVLPARLTSLKGHGLALQALSLLHKSYGPAALVFAGETDGHGGMVESLRQHISALKLDGKVRFVGHITDMPALYASADVVLSASIRPESFGRTMVEAQASARLTIAPAHGGALETIKDGETGFHFKPGDAADLARVMIKVIMLDTNKHRKICLAARKHAHAHYSRQTMCAKTLELYRDLLQTGEGT